MPRGCAPAQAARPHLLARRSASRSRAQRQRRCRVPGMHVDPQRLASSSDSRLPREVVDGSSAVGAGTVQLRTSHEAGEMREGIAARERHVFGVRLQRRREEADWARSRWQNIELGGDVTAQSTWGSVSDGRGRGGGGACGHAKVQEGRGCLARLGGRPGRGAVKVARATFFPVSLQGGQIPIYGYSARHYAGREKTDESGQGVSPRHTLYPHLLSVKRPAQVRWRAKRQRTSGTAMNSGLKN